MVDIQTLACGDYRVVLSESTIEEAEAAPRDEHYALGNESDSIRGVVRVEAMRDGTQIWCRFVSEPVGGAIVGERSAVCHDGHVFLIIGRMVASLDWAAGNLDWTCEGDDSQCFGLYRTPGDDALIVHGELDIARVSWTGRVEWRSGGRDIFTGPFQVERDAIYATDWNGDIYRIAYETGASAIIGHGKPFPH
jgi:outer membrane protein assembly factor BamB